MLCMGKTSHSFSTQDLPLTKYLEIRHLKSVEGIDRKIQLLNVAQPNLSQTNTMISTKTLTAKLTNVQPSFQKYTVELKNQTLECYQVGLAHRIQTQCRQTNSKAQRQVRAIINHSACNQPRLASLIQNRKHRVNFHLYKIISPACREKTATLCKHWTAAIRAD